MKCVTPARVCGSSREPAPIQNPIATERTPGMPSVTTRTPESSSVRAYSRITRILRKGLAIRPDPPLLTTVSPRARAGQTRWSDPELPATAPAATAVAVATGALLLGRAGRCILGALDELLGLHQRAVLVLGDELETDP